MNRETLRVFGVVSLIILAFGLLSISVVLQKKEAVKNMEAAQKEQQIMMQKADSLQILLNECQTKKME